VKVIVDTSVWSLALRHSGKEPSVPVLELRALIEDFRVQMLGVIRQELLSGVREKRHFDALEKHLRSFPDVPIATEDHVQAAAYFNLCRSKGVQGSSTDFLICAAAVRNGFSIFTTDRDFESFAEHLPIILHEPEAPRPGLRERPARYAVRRKK
jgi:predicted nucleic acid-binding protein